ncbi:uncharacterized protein PAC_08586 [Phialocephala subalpina]|uniref:Zn(2)-C6 fungal-type domain-containing protein n=1 Tax=Phialocephala subalpina TaxID=576137 RepID=A0A1L7X0Y9_9HELO|nr:uncharacterized protein PAC_08586 [Phialocephala subalpina]
MASRPAKTLTRSNITACLRCRRKKQKCDKKLPSCGPCQKANEECVGYDAVTQRPAPRSYIHSLEERIASLEIKLRDHGINCDGEALLGNATTRVSPHAAGGRKGSAEESALSIQVGSETLEAILAKSAQVTVESLSESGSLHVGSGNGISFTRMFLSELQWGGASFPESKNLSSVRLERQDMEYVTFEAPKVLDSSPVSLPSKKAAEYLTTVYFELANFSLPILHESTFRVYLTNAYASGEGMQSHGRMKMRNELFCFLAFAIALSALHKTDSSSVSSPVCDSYHLSALRCLEDVGLGVDIESVQVLLLLANYSYLQPSLAGTWKLVGMAVRLAIEQGLHKEPAQGQYNALELDTRRRIFWVAYSFDRNVGTYLGRPFSCSDGAITTAFPASAPDDAITTDGINHNASPFSKKVFALHYFRYRQLQSEMQTVLHERCPPYLSINYIEWQEMMHKRLSDWHASTPHDTSPSYIAPPEALEISYYTAIILLFRPSPAIPSPSDGALSILAQASSRTIQLYRKSVKEKKLRLFWQAAHNLFAAGTAILYCYSHSGAVRGQTSKQTLVSDVNACAAVLWAVVERFPAAMGTRDAFDTIMATALDQLEHHDPASPEAIHSEIGTLDPARRLSNDAIFGGRMSSAEQYQPPVSQNLWGNVGPDFSSSYQMDLNADAMMQNMQWLEDGQDLTSFYVDLN